MRYLTILLFSLIPFLAYSQKVRAISYIKEISNSVDSVIISTVHYDESKQLQPISTYITDADRRVLIANDWDDSIDRETYVLQSAKLSIKEINEFNKQLENTNGVVATPPDYDIQIDYYIGDSVATVIEISSMYKKITIINKLNCEEDINADDTYCIHYTTASKKFQKYITGLLQKKKLWDKDRAFFVW